MFKNKITGLVPVQMCATFRNHFPGDVCGLPEAHAKSLAEKQCCVYLGENDLRRALDGQKNAKGIALVTVYYGIEDKPVPVENSPVAVEAIVAEGPGMTKKIKPKHLVRGQ